MRRHDGRRAVRTEAADTEELSMRIVVDYDLCESNAICMGIAPEVFEVRDDDFLYVLDETPARGAAAQDRGGGPPLPEAGHQHRRGLILDTTVAIVGGLAGGPAGGGDAAPGGLRRHGRHRRGRGRGAPYDRPPLSKQLLSGRLGAWPTPALAGRRRRPRRRLGARQPGHRPATSPTGALALADGTHASPSTASSSPPAPRRGACPAPTGWPASTSCARSTTAWPSRPTSTPSPGRVVVVGAGFIGSEVAATCRQQRPRGHA